MKTILFMMGIEEGTFWDEHWVLYGNQFVNKFHIKKKKESSNEMYFGHTKVD